MSKDIKSRIEEARENNNQGLADYLEHAILEERDYLELAALIRSQITDLAELRMSLFYPAITAEANIASIEINKRINYLRDLSSRLATHHMVERE